GGFTIESTAKYIGRLLGTDAIKNEDIIFAQEKGVFPVESKQLTVEAPLFIGFRQMPLVRWPGTPLFFLDIVAVPRGTAATARSMPWTVTLRRDEDAGDDPAKRTGVATESFWIDRIVDRHGDEVSPKRLELRLQTLRNADGYWLDTGIVNVD